MSGIYVRQDGDWNPVEAVYLKQSGAWKPVETVHVKQAGSWQVAYNRAFRFEATLTGKRTNYNLATELRKAGWDRKVPVDATVTLAAGAVLGSSSTSTYAFDMGTALPESSVFTLVIGTRAYLVGAGGSLVPYSVGISAHAGSGGDALRVLSPVSIINDGIIGGGGGMGGQGGNANYKARADYPNQKLPGLFGTKSYSKGGGGGGGAGYVAGAGGRGASSGSLLVGGAGASGTRKISGDSERTGLGVKTSGRGGRGGGLGQPGSKGQQTDFSEKAPDGLDVDINSDKYGKPGGAAGKAVIGSRFVTWTRRGDVRGALA